MPIHTGTIQKIEQPSSDVENSRLSRPETHNHHMICITSTQKIIAIIIQKRLIFAQKTRKFAGLSFLPTLITDYMLDFL